MRVEERIHCCGIREWDDIENIESIPEAMLELAEDIFGKDASSPLPAFIFFSTTEGSSGAGLQKFISENGLGEIIRMRPRKNPNTGSMITMWTWGINKKTFKLWWMKSLVENSDELEDEDK